MGVGLGIQFVPLWRFGFLDRQHITDVILLGRNGIAVGIGFDGFHYGSVQRNGVFCTSKGIQTVVLNLIDAGLRSIDGLLQRNRLGVFCIGQCNGGRTLTYGNFRYFHISAGIHIDFVTVRSLDFFQKISARVQTGPLGFAVGIGLSGTHIDITGIGSVKGVIVSAGDRSGAGRISIQSKLCACQISGACGVGLSQRNLASTSTVGCPIATEIIESIRSILCGSIYLRLDSVDKASTEQIGRTLLCPDRSTM